MTKENSNLSNQVQPTNNGTISENNPAEKWTLANVRVKELLAEEDVQKAILERVNVPKELFIKKVKKSFQPEGAKDKTQKIEVMSGTTLADAVTFELTLLNTELDPVEAINKKYRIIDYALALEANMKERKFVGYAATGMKLMVTKLEEVKENAK